MKKPVIINSLKNHKDQRGDSFALSQKSLQYISNICNIHFATICPGYVRGNHYHQEKKEVIVIIYYDIWQFGYCLKNHDEKIIKQFDGQGAVSVEIEPEIAHAIKNTGTKDLFIIGCSSQAYDLNNPDIIREEVL
jgi:dTDP-4-dehydrorhamnose 3,5-epimerase-like enzyme